MADAETLSKFNWLSYLAPEFCVNGDQIEILDTPESFHSRLITEAKHSTKRIVLAALYLGTGTLEQELLDAVSEAASKTNNGVKIDILLDYVRGSRGNNNSKTMLDPLMQQCNEASNLNIALYHTPNLQGLVKTILPPRWNEVVGIAHLKVFIFDDTFIISGANLSHDYFVNRQDRYMVFRDCPQLADYFHDVVNAVSQFSFHLNTDGSVKLNPEWKNHPYEGDLNLFVAKAHESIRSVVCSHLSEDAQRHVETWCDKYAVKNQMGHLRKILNYCLILVSFVSNAALSLIGMASSVLDNPKQDLNSFPLPQNESTIKKLPHTNPLNNENLDTRIYPTIQMGLFGIRQDEVVTELLLKSFPKDSTVSFTTGYFNVTNKYCNVIVQSDANYKILLASPEANGFLGSRGFSGYIPAVYVHLCKKFYDKVISRDIQQDITLWEYLRDGWTFHGKGMWGYLPGEDLPSISLIGSPNFGLRSVNRDLEAQVVLVTKNQALRKKLDAEQKNLMKHTQRITPNTFQQPRYNVPRWVAVVTFFIKRYF